MASPIHISIGDLHGHMQALTTLISGLDQEIGIFLPNQNKILQPHVQLIFTGDYIDRGEDSLGVLKRVMGLKSNNPKNVTCLMGNHELLALADLYNARDLLEGDPPPPENLIELYEAWTLHGHNGGGATIKNFGDTDRQALENYTHAMSREQPLGQWVRNLEAFSIKLIRGKKTLYVHGGIPEELRNPMRLINHDQQFRKHMKSTTVAFSVKESKYGLNNDIVGGTSPYWDRSFPHISDTQAKEITKRLMVNYIVVGHTPQRNGVPANHGNCIFNMDVGMSPTYGGNTPTAFIQTEDGPHTFQPGRGISSLINQEMEMAM